MRDPILPVDPLTGRRFDDVDPTPAQAAAEQAALDVPVPPSPRAAVPAAAVTVDDDLAALVEFLQRRRRDTLRALRACTNLGADYWRWQGHAELSRQALELLGAEVPT